MQHGAKLRISDAKNMTKSPEGYVWGTQELERKRLLDQSALYTTETNWLLDRLHITAGATALDLGCGPLGILDLLSRRVGPSGKVSGVERESEFVDIAKETIASAELHNVEVKCGDATETGLSSNSFDIVHERLLLIVTPKVPSVIAEMIRLAKPGGLVITQDVDIRSWVCEPGLPAWDRFFGAFEQVYTEDGKDPYVGRRLPRLLRQAGLQNVQQRAHARLNRPGDFHQTQLLTFVKLFWYRIKDKLEASERAMSAMYEELEHHLSASGTVVVSPTLIQAWGYKAHSQFEP